MPPVKKPDNPDLFAPVKDKFIHHQWSPEEIAGRLRLGKRHARIRYATICRGIYVGVFDDEKRSHGACGVYRNTVFDTKPICDFRGRRTKKSLKQRCFRSLCPACRCHTVTAQSRSSESFLHHSCFAPPSREISAIAEMYSYR